MKVAPERKYATALASVDSRGRFCGYASLFGRVDLSGDIVEPGAFAKTLLARGASEIGMYLEHDSGSVIGLWLLVEEDQRGLWVEGRLGGSRAAGEAGHAMTSGRLDGLSIGFRTVQAEYDRAARVRRLKEIDLWEVSVVTSPMLPEARAHAVSTASQRRETPATAVDAGLLARMRRTTAFLRQTR
ncbi:MAG: HK97 family phage prohead protease [Pseudomonadota bacterium]